jgi:hypothetical protein
MNIESLFQSASFPLFRRTKKRIGHRFPFMALLLALLLTSVLMVTAQTPINPDTPPNELPTAINVVYSFSPANNYVPFLGYTNLEGAFCTANLIQDSDGKLYGVAPSGGDFGGSTVFSLNTDGSDFMVLHTFTYVSYVSNPSLGVFYQSNNDGINRRVWFWGLTANSTARLR